MEINVKPGCKECSKSVRLGNLLYCTVSGRAILPHHQHICVCRGKLLNGVKENMINTCEKCACNKVCDHNRFGFENCNNFIAITNENKNKKTLFNAITQDVNVLADWLEKHTPLWFGKRCDTCTTFKCQDCILELLQEECEND